MTESEQELRKRLRRLPDEPRIVITGNHVTPWHTLQLVDDELPAYKLWVLNAQKGVPDRDGVVLETPFVGVGMRKSPRLAYTPCRLSLVPSLFHTFQPPDAVILHTTRPRDGKLSMGTEVNVLPSAIEAVRRRGGLVVAQVNDNGIALQLNRGELASALIGDDKAPCKRADPMLLTIDAKLKRAGKGKRLVIDNETTPAIDQELVAMIVEAFSIRTQLFSGADDSIEAMTQRLNAGKGHLTRLVRLSYLAPDIVRALLEGRQPIELTPTRLLTLSKDLSHDWREQRRFLGFVDPLSPAGDRIAP